MRTTKGFSLIEMIMVIVITGFITSIVAVLLKTGFDSYNTGEAVTGLANQASISMTKMTKDLQKARQVISIGPNQITINLNNGQSITYQKQGTNLNRTGLSTKTQATDVENFTLHFYDETFNETTLIENIRAVIIELTLATADERVALINAIYLRNQ